jgi:hypothetical protein
MQYTINKLSELTGIDRRTLKKQLANKTPNEAGEYLAADVLEILKTRPKGLTAKHAMEARKLKAQCERIEFENEVRKGKFVPSEEVRRDLTRFILQAKAKLVSMPSSMAQTLALITDPIEIERQLKGRIHEFLRLLQTEQWGHTDCPHCGRRISGDEKENRPAPGERGN